MPKQIAIIDNNRSQVGQISSTEIRRRITEAKERIALAIKNQESLQQQTSMIPNQNNEKRVEMYPSFAYHNIAGLCTKGTIDCIIENEHASNAIIRLAMENPGLNLICIAPLTNLAVALKIEPNLPKFIGSLTIMGGTYKG